MLGLDCYNSNPVCMSGECASFSNSTNTNAKFNSCSFNNSKVQDKILSSHSSLAQEFDQKILESSDLPNKEYIATRNWEFYSEDKMKCSSPGVDMMSQNESIMLSDSALKAKPEKYKFPKQGLCKDYQYTLLKHIFIHFKPNIL